MSEASTKDLILDAAEQQFADKGFAGTSLRAIMKNADVNMASIHYHFGSKEALIEAVVRRIAEPINRERLALLDDLEASHPEGELPLRGVIVAFLTPVKRLYAHPRGRTFFPRLMGRMTMEAGEELSPVMASIFGETGARFMAALGRAVPHLDSEEVFWRLHFAIGAMAFAIAAPGIHHHNVHSITEPPDPGTSFDRLVNFVTAGMEAPAPTVTRKANK